MSTGIFLVRLPVKETKSSFNQPHRKCVAFGAAGGNKQASASQVNFKQFS